MHRSTFEAWHRQGNQAATAFDGVRAPSQSRNGEGMSPTSTTAFSAAVRRGSRSRRTSFGNSHTRAIECGYIDSQATRVSHPEHELQASPHELRRLKSALRAALATTFVGCTWETAVSTSSVIGDGALHMPGITSTCLPWSPASASVEIRLSGPPVTMRHPRTLPWVRSQ